MTELENMRWTISHLVEMMVDDLTAIDIRQLNSDETTVFIIKVAKEDIGKLIGKSGKNIMALRTIIGCFAKKNNLRFLIEVLQ